jgi:hypothetical protein
VRRKGDRTTRTYLRPREILLIDLDPRDPEPQKCWVGNTLVLLRWGMYYKVVGDRLIGPYNTVEDAARQIMSTKAKVFLTLVR